MTIARISPYTSLYHRGSQRNPCREEDAAVNGPALLGARACYPAGTAAQDPDSPQVRRYADGGQQGDQAVEASRVDPEDYRHQYRPDNIEYQSHIPTVAIKKTNANDSHNQKANKDNHHVEPDETLFT